MLPTLDVIRGRYVAMRCLQKDQDHPDRNTHFPESSATWSGIMPAPRAGDEPGSPGRSDQGWPGRLNAIPDDPKGDTVRQTAAMAEADRAWMIDTLLALLQTPSPSGRTDMVMQVIGNIFDHFGVPFSLTRRGALTAELTGKSAGTDRALVVHADTIGCMVRK